MRQLTCTGPGTIEWRDVPEPRLQADVEALVRPLAVARCDIDLFLTAGLVPLRGPFALGHECVAEVVALGNAVRGLEVGQRVVVAFQVSCGTCSSCVAGHTDNCDKYPISVVWQQSPGPSSPGASRRAAALVLQRPWADGTTHLAFTPTELLERLVPLVPRPRINLVIYHGVLAPNAPWRRAVVALDSGVALSAARVSAPVAPDESTPGVDARRPRIRPRYRSWAELMRRVFETDVLACPRCGGRMVVLATIDDPAVIARILTHLGLSMDPGEPAPGRAPPEDSPASA